MSEERQTAGYISLKTKCCIVTGKIAKCWTGHVLAHDFRGIPISIIAGFADSETLRQAKMGACGYFGPWKRAFGVRVDIGLSEGEAQVIPPHILEAKFGLIARAMQEKQ